MLLTGSPRHRGSHRQPAACARGAQAGRTHGSGVARPKRGGRRRATGGGGGGCRGHDLPIARRDPHRCSNRRSCQRPRPGGAQRDRNGCLRARRLAGHTDPHRDRARRRRRTAADHRCVIHVDCRLPLVRQGARCERERAMVGSRDVAGTGDRDRSDICGGAPAAGVGL